LGIPRAQERPGKKTILPSGMLPSEPKAPAILATFSDIVRHDAAKCSLIMKRHDRGSNF
jgi:hypothetical protein